MQNTVVGVNWMQAVQFAEWRTDRVNEFILEREAYLEKDTRYNTDVIDANSTFSTSAYLKVPEQTYGGKIDSIAGKKGKIKKDTTEVNNFAGVEKEFYSILPSPTESEWEYAALH